MLRIILCALNDKMPSTSQSTQSSATSFTVCRISNVVWSCFSDYLYRCAELCEI